MSQTRALLRWVSDLESQKTVKTNSSGTQSQSDIKTLPTQHNLHSLASTNAFPHTASDPRLNNVQPQLPRVDTATHQLNAVTALSQPLRMDVSSSQVTPSTLLAQQADTQVTHFPSDGVLPGINVLRQNQNILQSVAQVLASYEA